MKYYLLAILSILTLSIAGCNKIANNKYVTANHMVLMHHTMGGGDNYLIADGKVLKDTTVSHRNPNSNNYNVELSPEKYEHVAHLLSEIPETLLDQNNTRFTSTEVWDADGVTVKATINGSEYEWYFYAHTKDMKRPVRTYADKVFNALYDHLVEWQ